jgi:hypothetical protein
MAQLDQKQSISWPVQDTGLRAYEPVSNGKRIALDKPELQRPAFADIDKRVSEAAETSQPYLDDLKKLFVFRDEMAVTHFLSGHRTVPQLLMDAHTQLANFFGQDTVFALKVLTDEDGSRELYVVAEWSGQARQAMSALDSFVDRWWIGQSGPIAGRVSVTYELI